jgi:hypothetical protein
MKTCWLLVLMIDSMIACNVPLSASAQARSEESIQVPFVLLERGGKFNGTSLIMDVLVDPNLIDREHLEELFKGLTKDKDKYPTIYIFVWDDRQAWGTVGNSFAAKFLSAEEYQSAARHLRATYGKRNTPPVVESYSYHPSPGSTSVRIDLVTGKEKPLPKEEAK